jgi:hypothetical protein
VKCAGCQKELEVGDRYIEDTASGFIGKESNPEIDSLVADIMGGDASGSTEGKVVFCDDCTVSGGDYLFETYWGDDE